MWHHWPTVGCFSLLTHSCLSVRIHDSEFIKKWYYWMQELCWGQLGYCCLKFGTFYWVGNRWFAQSQIVFKVQQDTKNSNAVIHASIATGGKSLCLKSTISWWPIVTWKSCFWSEQQNPGGGCIRRLQEEGGGKVAFFRARTHIPWNPNVDPNPNKQRSLLVETILEWSCSASYCCSSGITHSDYKSCIEPSQAISSAAILNLIFEVFFFKVTLFLHSNKCSKDE